MTLDLLNLSAIASTAITIRPIARMVNAMAMIQSNPSPIELADTWQRRLFVTSVIFGVAAALIGALLAWLLWRANNRYQEAVTADANARIEEAQRGAEEARRAAAEANEKTKGLELRIEEESRKRVEAEERLERVRKKVAPRGLEVVPPPVDGERPTVWILFQPEDPEAYLFADGIHKVLRGAEWNVREPLPAGALVGSTATLRPVALRAGAINTDVTIRARELFETPPAGTGYAALYKMFADSDLSMHWQRDAQLSENVFWIVVGPKW